MADTFAGRDYLHVLRRGWLVVVVFAVLGGAVGWGITLTSTKVYRAYVQLFAATSVSSSKSFGAFFCGEAGPCGGLPGNNFTQGRAQSYTRFANSPAVTNSVVRQLRHRGLGITSQQLAAKISAEAPQDEPLVNVHVTDQDPARAAELANAVARRLSTVVERIEQTPNGKPVVKLIVIHPATIPASPIGPDAALNIGLGVLVGLLLGAGVVIARGQGKT